MRDIQKEIKEALEKAAYIYQVHEMDDNEDYQQTNLIGSRDWEEDVELPSIEEAYLLGNAHTWLSHQQETIEQKDAEIERLKKQLQASRDSVYGISVEADDARFERSEAQESLEIAIKALEWYADKEHYENYGMGVEIWEDKGKLANQFLEEIKRRNEQ